jgi:hypothetical protein
VQISLVATPIWNMKTPPLTSAYLTAFLELQGHDVLQLDWNVELFTSVPEGLQEYWDRTHLHKWQDHERYAAEIAPRITGPTIERYARRLLADRPGLIGISIYSVEASLHLARVLRDMSPGIVLVAGGQVCDPGFYGHRVARSDLFDAVVYGEGEGPLLDIVARVEAGTRDFSAIRGLLLPVPGGVEDTGLRDPVADVDTLPWPQFDGLPMDSYRVWPGPNVPSRAVSTLMSRGCVRKCDFCLQAEIWQNFRYRRAEDVYAEMAAKQQRHGLAAYHFNDLLINGNVKQLDKLCDLLLANPLSMTWGGNAICSKNFKRPLLEKMKAAGCEFLGFGFESFSTPVLEAMGKKYDAEDVARLVRDLREVGIRFFSNLIIGHPREGRREFAETIRFLVEHAEYFWEAPTSSLLIVQKNTPIHRAIDHWQIEMEDGDALGWRTRDGSNTLAERKHRAQVLNFFYESLFQTSIKITDMDTEHDLTLRGDDVIPRTAQAN